MTATEPDSPLVIGKPVRFGPGRARHVIETQLAELYFTGRATSPAPVPGPRLSLRSATERGGFVDGGWWPYSLDLGQELPAVLRALFEHGYAVHRVTYNLIGWTSPPATLTVDGRVISLGGVRNQSRSSITLVDTDNTNSATVNRLHLVVVPPDTEQVIAERALRLSGQDGYRFRPAEILVQAAGRH